MTDLEWVAGFSLVALAGCGSPQAFDEPAGGSSGAPSSTSSTTTGPSDDPSGSTSGSASEGDPESTGVVDACGDGALDEAEDCDPGEDQPWDDCTASCGAAFEERWSHSYDGPASRNDIYYDLFIDDTGAAVVLGRHALEESERVFIQRFEPDGTPGPMFEPSLDEDDVPFALQRHPSGDLVLGIYRGEVGVGTHLVVSRFDPNSRTAVWSTFVDGTGLGVDVSTGGVAITDDGTVWVGHQQRNEDGVEESVITPFNDAGTPQRSQRFDYPNHTATIHDVVAADGTVYASVSVTWFDPDVGWQAEYYIATTGDADVLETRAELDFVGARLAPDPQGGLVIAGQTFSEVDDADLVIAKLDADFDEVFRTPYQSGRGSDFVADVVVDESGRVFAVGTEPDDSGSVDLWLGVVDGDGAPAFSMSYLADGFPERGEALALTPDGGVLVVGSEFLGAQRFNGWIQQLDVAD